MVKQKIYKRTGFLIKKYEKLNKQRKDNKGKMELKKEVRKKGREGGILADKMEYPWEFLEEKCCRISHNIIS